MSLAKTGRIIQELAEDLECPVCYEFPSQLIFTCVVGHLICGRCHAMLKTCPLCRERLVGTRSFFAEHSVSAIRRIVCGSQSNMTDRSPEKEASSESAGHPIQCCLSVNGCRNQLLNPSTYINHLKIRHSVMVVHAASGEFVHKVSLTSSGKFVKRGVERLFILEVHGNAFIINMYQEGNEVRVWAMTEILARRRYIPQVELAVLNDKKVKPLVWEGAVNGLHVNHRSVLLSGNYLKINGEDLKRFLHQGEARKFWKLSVKVQDVEPWPWSRKIQLKTAVNIRLAGKLVGIALFVWVILFLVEKFYTNASC